MARNIVKTLHSERNHRVILYRLLAAIGLVAVVATAVLIDTSIVIRTKTDEVVEFFRKGTEWECTILGKGTFFADSSMKEMLDIIGERRGRERT